MGRPKAYKPDITPSQEFFMLRARMIQAARKDGMTLQQISKVLFIARPTILQWERWAREKTGRRDDDET